MKKIIKYNFLFFLIILFGILIRSYLIITRNIFTDEIFYTEIALKYNFKNIILINHWIKDHAILYYLFLKIFLFLTSKIELLRFTNLVFYLFSCLFIIYIFKEQLKLPLLSLIILFFYSFNYYFVYLNSWISPFNLVLFFSFISILFLIYIAIKITHKTEADFKLINHYLIFSISTILSFYSDYSMLFLFFLYLIFFIYFIFSKLIKKELKLLVLNTYLLILIFIVPGLFQIFININKIKNLNNFIFNYDLFNFLKKITSSFIFRINNSISLIFLIFIFLIFFTTKNKVKILKNLNIIFIFSFVITILFQYYINKFLFSTFTERSFWYFHIQLIFIFSLSLYIFLQKSKKIKKIYQLIAFLLFLIPIFSYINKFNIEGNIKHQINYKEIKELKNNNQTTFFIVNKFYDYYPITNYFLSYDFNKNKKINSMFFLIKNIEKSIIYKNIQNMIYNNKNNDKKIVIIFINVDKINNDFLKKIKNLNKKIKIYNLYSYE